MYLYLLKRGSLVIIDHDKYVIIVRSKQTRDKNHDQHPYNQQNDFCTNYVTA